MHTDDFTGWPAPAPEAEVLAWVEKRAQRIRRRRILARALPASALSVGVAMAALAGPGGSTLWSGNHIVPAGSDRDGGGGAAPATDAAAVRQHAARATASQAPPTSTTSTTSPVSVRVWAPVVSDKVDPPKRVERSNHPLLTDPEGDATGELPGDQPDRAVDLTELDVNADAKAVTMSARVVNANSEHATGHMSLRYDFTLILDDRTYFLIELERWVDTGDITLSGMFNPATANGDCPGCSAAAVQRLRGSVDLNRGIVTVVADINALNDAIHATRSTRAAIGLGTPVQPTARAFLMAQFDAKAEDWIGGDEGFTYRLGD